MIDAEECWLHHRGGGSPANILRWFTNTALLSKMSLTRLLQLSVKQFDKDQGFKNNAVIFTGQNVILRIKKHQSVQS